MKQTFSHLSLALFLAAVPAAALPAGTGLGQVYKDQKPFKEAP